MNKSLIRATAKLGNLSTSASLDAEVLLSYVLNKNRAWLLAHPEYELNCIQKIKYNSLIKKRTNNLPIAYLTGVQEFYALKFNVNKHTLVPRPESELFIDELNQISPANQTIIDIGTGSGCLIVTAAKLFPNNIFIAVDISKKALRVARQNAKQHRVSIKFIQSNLLKFLKISNYKLDIVIANLPYLKPEQIDEPSIKQEPKRALIAGNNGLKYYKQLLKQISRLPYKPKYIYFEIDPKLAQPLTMIINSLLPGQTIQEIKDLSDRTRLLKIY